MPLEDRALGHATAVTKAPCSPAGTGNEAVVDLDSHRSFARLRTVCVGTLHGTGVIDAGALFVLQDVGPAQDASTEVVRVDLTTYAVARSTALAGGFSMFAGLGAIWVLTNSTNVSLLQLSPVTLRVLHRFADPDGAWVQPASRLLVASCTCSQRVRKARTRRLRSSTRLVVLIGLRASWQAGRSCSA